MYYIKGGKIMIIGARNQFSGKISKVRSDKWNSYFN